MKYEFHPEAEQELIEAALRYDFEIPGLGQQFGNEVARALELLLGNPELGSRIDEHLRHFVLRRFPFSIVYAATSALVYIVAVAHGSREPGYWKPRVHDR